MKMFLMGGALLLSVSGTSALATPAVMVQAKDAVIIAGGPGFGTLVETYDQTGLFAGYVDEVTPLHPYLATNPMHSFVFAGNEWFGEQGSTSAITSYYVDASVSSIDHFILWNEDYAGIGSFYLWYGATAGAMTDLVLARVFPPDNPGDVDYGASLWEFSARPSTGWWTLEMQDCPQPNPAGFAACAIGEVAFGGPRVPEPATWGMLIAGFGLVGIAARKGRKLRTIHD